MENRIKQFRVQLGLSQKRLAELVGTSQQQIQRIETGAVAARLELATKLSEVLEKPLDVVFPGSGKALMKLEKELKKPMHVSSETLNELGNLGVEADSRTWFFRVLLRGHKEPLDFEIPAAEQRRLFGLVQQEKAATDGMSFVVFDTSSERIAMNLGDLLYCHFIYEMGNVVRKDEDEVPDAVQVYFSGNESPFAFDVDSDSPDDDGLGEFGHIFFMMETYAEKHERYAFQDAGGEWAFLRAGDVAMMRVPLWVVEPQDWEEGGNDDDE